MTGAAAGRFTRTSYRGPARRSIPPPSIINDRAGMATDRPTVYTEGMKAAAASRAGSAWYVLGAAGLIGGALLIKHDAASGYARPLREGVLGGILAGAGLALLALLEAPKRLGGSRVAASIPLKPLAGSRG